MLRMNTVQELQRTPVTAPAMPRSSIMTPFVGMGMKNAMMPTYAPYDAHGPGYEILALPLALDAFEYQLIQGPSDKWNQKPGQVPQMIVVRKCQPQQDDTGYEDYGRSPDEHCGAAAPLKVLSAVVDGLRDDFQ